MDNDRCAIDAECDCIEWEGCIEGSQGVSVKSSCLARWHPSNNSCRASPDSRMRMTSRRIWRDYATSAKDRRETAAKTLFKQMRDVNHPLHSLVPDDRQQSTRRSLRNGNHISTPKYSDSNTSLNGL
ncbi:hypothetical protein Bbelb_035630 [Branchiostoma belcheri]|nr:hypothetical protein Bbelb_035630 [Branchiostoma belcheri]